MVSPPLLSVPSHPSPPSDLFDMWHAYIHTGRLVAIVLSPWTIYQKKVGCIDRLIRTRHRFGQEDYVGTLACYTSIESEGCVQDDWTIVGGIRFNYKGFKANTLMPVVFAKKVLERHLLHNRGYSCIVAPLHSIRRAIVSLHSQHEWVKFGWRGDD